MNKNLKPQLSSKTDNWITPEDLYKKLEEKFGKFDFDPCPLNSYDKTMLLKDWKGNVFCNPPYSNVKEFLNKALVELNKGSVTQVVFLIIPRTSTKYWEDYVMNYADSIGFINKRLKFGESKSCAPFPSCIIHFTNTRLKETIPCYTWKYKRKK